MALIRYPWVLPSFAQVQNAYLTESEMPEGESDLATGRVARFIFYGPPDENIFAVGVSSQEAFGSASVTLRSTISGIITAESFGTPLEISRVSTSGISSSESFGTALEASRAIISGIASAEAFGDAVVDSDAPPVTQTVILTGIATQEAFGTPQVTLQDIPRIRPPRHRSAQSKKLYQIQDRLREDVIVRTSLFEVNGSERSITAVRKYSVPVMKSSVIAELIEHRASATIGRDEDPIQKEKTVEVTVIGRVLNSVEF